MRRAPIFRIRRIRPDCWVLHCHRCGTNEENKTWRDAVAMLPHHERFWHSKLVIVPWQERIR